MRKLNESGLSKQSFRNQRAGIVRGAVLGMALAALLGAACAPPAEDSAEVPPPEARRGAAPEARHPASPEETAKYLLDTDFSICDEPRHVAKAADAADAGAFNETLHGVWVGQRTQRKGQADPAHYLLVFDLEAREGLAFEERGPGIAANAFSRRFAKALGDSEEEPLSLTYFYCGGEEFGAFKDVFTKVSDEPRDGLAALARHTRVEMGAKSIFDAHANLRRRDFFTAELDGALRNTALYTIATVPVTLKGDEAQAVRWDMVGQYRGSPAKFVHGQPIAGREGGFFRGLTAPGGKYFVAHDVAVLCFCDPTKVDWETGSPLTNFAYDKVILGPLPG